MWLGDDFNSGFEQCLGLLFSNSDVLPKPIVWLGNYSVNSKNDSDCVVVHSFLFFFSVLRSFFFLCSSISQFCGC